MRAKHHLILYTFLSLALIVAVFVCFQYAMEAERAKNALEDGYAQRLLEARERLQAMGLKINKAAVAGDARTRLELLAGVSRQADSIAAGLSALPLSHVAMADTVKFCNQLSEYAMSLALRLSAGAEPSPEETARLGELETQCALLLGQLSTAQNTMVTESLRMATLENVYYAEAQLSARPLEQVADADNGMDYPSMIYDGAFSDARHYGTPKALGDARINAAQAVDIASRYVGQSRVREAAQSAETAGTLASYGVALTLTDGTVLNAEVTKQGGKLLWMVPEHASFAPSLTVEECEQAALSFLKGNGYGDMEPNHYQVYDGLAVINFVALQNGVLLYPDLVKAQVRMDTGEVVGMEANNYLMNHTLRSNLTPALTQQDAAHRVSARLNVTGTRLCVIPWRDGERLCYEVAGDRDGGAYRVYVDANTGEEAEILMMLQTSDGRMGA